MDQLIAEAEKHVHALFDQYCDETFVFHNYHHTQTVTARAVEIAMHENLGETELKIIAIAALFHDTGYLFTAPAQHEAESVKRMTEFFTGKEISPVVISEAAACIMATKMPTHPSNILQQVLCDADTYHFGTPEFATSNEKVYREFKLRNNGPDWNVFLHGSVSLLQSHTFYTKYCRELLQPGKEENLARFIRSL